MKSLYYLCTSKLNTIKYDLPELHVHDDLLLCQVDFFFFNTYIPALFFIKCHHPKSRPQSNFHLPIRHICVQTNNIFSHFPTYNVANQPQTKALSNRFKCRVCYQLLLEMEREYPSLFLFSSCTGQPGETGGSPAMAPPLLC